MPNHYCITIESIIGKNIHLPDDLADTAKIINKLEPNGLEKFIRRTLRHVQATFANNPAAIVDHIFNKG